MNRTLVAALAQLDRDNLARHRGQRMQLETKGFSGCGGSNKGAIEVIVVVVSASVSVTRAGRAWRAVTEGA